MSTIAARLAEVSLGSLQQHENLGVVPLLASAADSSLTYLLLSEALTKGLCQVKEVSEGGVVAELSLENFDETPVLLVDGEELIGAKQNRVLNLTILCSGKARLPIPVSCVEQGRWNYRSAAFASGERNLFGSARAAKSRSVSASMRAGSRRSNQGEVWACVEEMSTRHSAKSDTGAVGAVFEKQKPRTDAFVAAFSPMDSQVGAAYLINGKVVNVELFDRAATYARFANRLVEGHAIDAVATAAHDSLPYDAAEVRCFLDTLAGSEAVSYTAVGLGQDLRIEQDALHAAALEVNGTLLHLTAFASAPSPKRRQASTSVDLRAQAD